MAGALDILKPLLFAARPQRAIPTLDGAYLPNDRLDALPVVESDLVRPDDIAVGPDGTVLVSTQNRLLRLSGPDLQEQAVVVALDAPITALAQLRDGRLIVGLNGSGLCLLRPDGTAEIALAHLDGAPLRSVTAIAEDPARGGVFFTVGSLRRDAEDWVWDLMERNSAGLLGYWQPDAGRAEILLERLPYPNGLEVEDGGESLLFTQGWTHSVMRYRIGAKGSGAVETVIDNLPGYPARIAPACGGGYWLAIFAMRTQLIELVLRETSFRQEMMRVVDPELWVRPSLRATGSYLEPLQGGGIKKLGIRKPWAPPRSYGLVVRLDADAEPVFSMHSRVDGHCHGITAAREQGGRLIVVSKGDGRLCAYNLEGAGDSA
jgi:sugar lactone lactonase YvrE